MRTTGIFTTALSLTLLVTAPVDSVRAACGTHCPLPVHRATVAVSQAVTQIVEVAVPVVAVSFAYLAPPAQAVNSVPAAAAAPAVTGTLPPVAPQRFAALPYDPSEASSLVPIASSAHSSSTALLRQRCASCHEQQARGGVRLWDQGGRLQPARAGKPLSRQAVWQVIREGRMPPSGPLPENEQIELVRELLE